jgi:hypothetical protein
MRCSDVEFYLHMYQPEMVSVWRQCCQDDPAAPELRARMEYEERVREIKHLKARLDQIRMEMSMRANSI